MDAQPEAKKEDSSRLTLQRIYTKGSSFESFGLNLSLLQNPVQPTLDLKIFSNNYPQENNLYQVILSLKIEAKHQAEVIWRIQLEQSGYYTLEGFSEEQQKDILNGFCLNQLYQYAGPIVNQMVTHAGFAPLYLQPMDFYQLYQQQKNAKVEGTPDMDTASRQTQSTDLSSAMQQLNEKLDQSYQTVN
jgi:preprotein translocase subunit SecB